MSKSQTDPLGLTAELEALRARVAELESQAGEKLERERSILEAALDSTADGLLLVGTRGEVLSFNRQFLIMWDLPESAVAANDCEHLVQLAAEQLEDPEAFLTKVRELCAQPEKESFDILKLKNKRVFERYSKPQRLGGEIVGRVLSFRDVTAQKLAEESLQREREFLCMILENLSEAILACDPDGVPTLYNRATRQLFGLPAGPLPEEPWTEQCTRYIQHFEADGRTPMPPENAPLARALRGESVAQEELVIVPLNGSPRSLLASGNAILSRQGDKLGAVVVMRDITEWNKLQQQLQQHQKLESIGTLAGGIAHDFNNLLSVILGNASVHHRDRGLSPKVRESLADIMSAAERGSALTSQLLMYARGGLQQPVPIDVNKLIPPVVQMLRRTTSPQINFELKLGETPIVFADPNQIEQVVMNLCLNAIQACNSRGLIEVSTSSMIIDSALAVKLELKEGLHVCVEVRDDGCGMGPETLERIFEPFFSTKFTGRGMGLAAAEGIIKTHGGQICATSEPGSGTTMTVWLPVPEDTGKRPPRPRRRRLADPPQGTETVLVIDDDAALTRTVSQILSALGYSPISHDDVDDALKFLGSNADDVDLILLDLNMPKCSGPEMLSKVRQMCPGAPVLVISGFDSPDLTRELKKAGAAGFLPKPFSIGALASSIRKTLDEAPEDSGRAG